MGEFDGSDCKGTAQVKIIKQNKGGFAVFERSTCSKWRVTAYLKTVLASKWPEKHKEHLTIRKI